MTTWPSNWVLRQKSFSWKALVWQGEKKIRVDTPMPLSLAPRVGQLEFGDRSPNFSLAAIDFKFPKKSFIPSWEEIGECCWYINFCELPK